MRWDSEPIDLVVSTGPRTAAANIALARFLGARNIYFGFSKWPADRGFALLLTPEPCKPGARRSYVLRPSEVDATELPEPRPLVANGTVRHASLLFGGQSKHYMYAEADMRLLAERLM